MSELRDIGSALDVKDNKKADLIEKILEAEGQLETASTIESEELINDDTKAESQAEELAQDTLEAEEDGEELFDGEPPLVPELWEGNKLDPDTQEPLEAEVVEEAPKANPDWCMTEGLDLIRKGHSIGSLIGKYCMAHNVKASHAAKQGIYSRCNAVLREKRYEDLFDILRTTFK